MVAFPVSDMILTLKRREGEEQVRVKAICSRQPRLFSDREESETLPGYTYIRSIGAFALSPNNISEDEIF